MRIRDAHIELFGPLRDVRMDGLPDGLTVVLGRNEAGKSTLLDFFRATLTGYPVRPQGRDAAYLQRGRAAGSLTLDTSQGLVRLSRRSGPGGGTLALYGADGQRLEAGVWQALLGGVTRDIYSRIYGFGLGELQNLATLNDGQIRNALYGAGFGVGLRSPGEALKKLTDMMGTLFKPSGTRQPVAQALRDWEQLGQQIREAREQLEAYDAMAVRQAELQQIGQARNTELACLEQERRRLEKRLAVWQRWDEWRVLGVRLDRLPAVPETVPADASARLRELCARVDAAQRQADREQAKWAQLQDKIAALHPDDALAGALGTLRTLGECKGACRSALRELPDRAGELARARASLARELAALGPGWTAENVLSRRPGVEVNERLARLAAALQGAERASEIARSEDKLAARELTLAGEAMREVQAKAGSLAREPLPHRDALDGKLAALRELRGLLTLYPVEESRLGEQCERLEAHMARRPDTASRPALLVLGALLLAGGAVTALTAGLGWPALTLPSGTVWPLELWQGAAGVLGGAVLLALGVPRHSQQAGRHAEMAATLQARAEETRRKLESLHSRMLELAEKLGLETLDAAHLDALDTALNRERERGLDMERRWQAVKTLHEERDRRLAQAKSAVQEAREACERTDAEVRRCTDSWRQALTALGFDPSLSPATVREALQHVEQAIRQTEAIARLEAALTAGQAAVDAFWNPLQALCEKLGRAPYASPAEGVASFDALFHEASLAAAACAERERLQDQLDRQTQELHTARAFRAEAQGDLASLLRLAETDDPEEFLRRAAIRTEAVELNRRREILRAELWIAGSDAARLERPDAGAFTEEDFVSYLEGFVAVDRDSLETRLQQTIERLAVLNEERQRDEKTLREQAYALRQLATSEELAVLHGRQEAAAAQLRRNAMEWARLALARQMLEKAKARFERERQPEVIRLASRLLSLMTDGAWSTVSMALDGDTLTVLPPVGEGVTPDLLSRGTQEQLYLALRLAHVRQQARLGGVSLPLIMDDILVNFDPERAGRTAGVLEEMVTPSEGVEGHQVLFFTCHPHIASLLRERMPAAAFFVMEQGTLRREA